jgi:predicted RNA binding protein YcfA (HicA-like mRNA interferase family)
MKKRDLERHLREHGCYLVRQGGKHEIWQNPATNETAPIPRGNEIKNHTAVGICKELSVPPPRRR